MKPWQTAVVGLAFLAIAGCRVDPSIPILERELRLKEDEIYRLRGMLEDMQDCPVTCREHGDGGHVDADGSSRRKSPAASPHGATPPQIELPGKATEKTPDLLKAPAGSMPGGSVPSGVPEVPPELQGPSRPAPSADGPTLDVSDGRAGPRTIESVSFIAAGDSSRVASIALDRVLTGGISADERAGDQGLLVVVEPRDSAGRIVEAPADMIVVVLDPELEGEAMRIGRWEYAAAETANLFRRSPMGSAVHLSLGWPDASPKHKKLHVFVRYVTADGRSLQTDQWVEIALPGEKSARWTPSDQTAQTGPALQGPPPAKDWKPNELPSPPVEAAPIRTATRTSPTSPARPAWSPERR